MADVWLFLAFQFIMWISFPLVVRLDNALLERKLLPFHKGIKSVVFVETFLFSTGMLVGFLCGAF